jgi:hypothetical protein
MTMTGYDSELPIVLIPNQSGKRSLQEEVFWEFHQNNPMVYEAMVGFAREIRRGIGPDAKLEVQRLYWRVRWELNIRKLDGCIKLNNCYMAYYARLIMLQEPELKVILVTRKRKTKSTPDK